MFASSWTGNLLVRSVPYLYFKMYTYITPFDKDDVHGAVFLSLACLNARYKLGKKIGKKMG